MPDVTTTGLWMTAVATILALTGLYIIHTHWFSLWWFAAGLVLTVPAFGLMHMGADTLVQREEDDSYTHSF